MTGPGWSAVGRLEVPPKDKQRFRRYLALADRMDGLFHREIPAIRRHDDDEFARLEALVAHARSQRTNVAVDMGLQASGS